MPCRCEGEGWDGCDPATQERERRKAEIRRRVAQRVAETAASVNLLSAPAPANLLDTPMPGETDAPSIQASMVRADRLGLPTPNPKLHLSFEGEEVYVRSR